MDEFIVTPNVVMAAAMEWQEEGARLTTAAQAVADAPTSGFGDGVEGDAAAFLSTWQQHTSETATRAEAVADQLKAGWAAYLGTDIDAQRAFDDWLAGAP